MELAGTIPGLNLNIYLAHRAVLRDKHGFLSSMYAAFPSVTGHNQPGFVTV